MLKVAHVTLTDVLAEEEIEENVSPQSPYNTRSAQQARKHDDSKVIIVSQAER